MAAQPKRMIYRGVLSQPQEMIFSRAGGHIVTVRILFFTEFLTQGEVKTYDFYN